MEEKHKKISAIISRLTASNKYITSSQAARAKAIYNGDPRDIEEIEKEIEEYSAEIEARGRAKEKETRMEQHKEQQSSINPEIPQNIPISQPIDEYELVEEQSKQAEIENMFKEFSNSAPIKEEQHTIEKPVPAKVLTKTAINSINNAGQENVEGLLTLSIIFSIATIIVAFFALISN